MKRSIGYLLFAFAGFAGGCGSAASFDYALPESKAETLLTVYGHVTDSDPGVMTRGTRAALVWFPTSPGAGVQVSQDLGRPVMTDVLDMQINVTRAPPLFPTAGTREAELVFYLDGDGNGQLDVYQLGATSPDRVVGRAPNSRVIWGGLATTDTSKVGTEKKKAAGQVCTKEAPDFSLTCGMKDDDPGSAPWTPISIRFSNEEVLGGYTCSRFWGSQEFSDDSPRFSEKLRQQVRSGCTAVSPNESTAEGACQCKPTDDGGWKACVSDPNLCGTVFCHVAAPSAAPSGCPG